MSDNKPSKAAFDAAVLLIISEYAPINTAWEAESELLSKLDKLTPAQEREYQQLSERVLNFNERYMYKLCKKHPPTL